MTFRCRSRGARRAEWATTNRFSPDRPAVLSKMFNQCKISPSGSFSFIIIIVFNYYFVFNLFPPQPVKMHDTPKWGSRRNSGGREERVGVGGWMDILDGWLRPSKNVL